jgi:polyphenol oxidase
LRTMPFTLKKTGSWSYFGLSDLDGTGIVHGFCTMSTPPPPWDPGTRQDFLSAFSLLDYVTMTQEHKDDVHIMGEGVAAPQVGDGLVLLKKGVAGIIRTADCVPIILWEPQRGIAAIVHAGWRGTVLRIAGKAAGLMVDLGAEPSLIQALIGPCIGPCCYEVKEEVLHRFQEAGFGREAFHHRQGALFLDLRQANVEDLQGRGVCRVQVLDLCTRCREDLFFSARRNDTGRQMSFVAVTG